MAVLIQMRKLNLSISLRSKYMKHKPSWYFQKNRKGIAFRFYVGRVKELSPSIVFNIGILWWDFGYAY